MKNLLFLFFIILIIFSCKKGDSGNHISPPGDDSTSFVIPETENIVMYEVNLRAFSSTGDIQGVTDRLADIKELGINVIWLMPIFPVGIINSVNSPYCVRNYEEVNPEFGSLDDLRSLVKEAHKKGMAIVLDWVANHTAWDNPWIVNKDWYTQDESGNIIHPPGTNWLDVADLNYSNQDMRLNMIAAMEYWITSADIDGFRCDAADMIPYDFWVQALDSINGFTEKKLIWLAEGSRNDHFTAGFQMNYAWSYYNKLKNVFNNNEPAAGIVSTHLQEYNSIPAGKHKLRFTTNHDESAWDATPMVIFHGEQGALAASAAAIFLGGVPLIYGSQEVGVTGNIPFFSHSEIDWSQHPEMLRDYKDILKFYNEYNAFKDDTLASYSNNNVLAFTRKSGPAEVFVILNVRNNPVNYDIATEFENTAWKDAFNDSSFTFHASIDLGAYQYIILKK